MNESVQSIPEKNHNVPVKVRSIAISLLVIGFLLAMAGVRLAYYDGPLFPAMAVFVASIILFIMATLLLKINLNIMVALIGLCITCLSFAYQPLGPEIRQHGTECMPIEDCFSPVRGGGFPIQYVIDSPGISVPDSLGSEDEFRLWALVLDTIFYFGLWQIVYRINMYCPRGSNT